MSMAEVFVDTNIPCKLCDNISYEFPSAATSLHDVETLNIIRKIMADPAKSNKFATLINEI